MDGWMDGWVAGWQVRAGCLLFGGVWRLCVVARPRLLQDAWRRDDEWLGCGAVACGLSILSRQNFVYGLSETCFHFALVRSYRTEIVHLLFICRRAETFVCLDRKLFLGALARWRGGRERTLGGRYSMY
jgi:hypothetical protein